MTPTGGFGKRGMSSWRPSRRNKNNPWAAVVVAMYSSSATNFRKLYAPAGAIFSETSGSLAGEISSLSADE